MRPTSRLTFLIVEDHPLTRAGTRAMLEQAFRDCLCEEASSLREARLQVKRRAWTLVLLDLRLPDGRGLDLLAGCTSPVFVLSMDEDAGMKERMLSAGACGFSSKSDAPETIVKAIASILPSRPGSSESPKRMSEPSLSIRERQVLRHLLDGRPLAEMAQELGVSPTTVQSYKKRLFEKLSVETIPELVNVAAKRIL